MPRKPTWPPKIYPHAPSGRDRIRVNGDDYWLGPSGSDEAKAEYARLVALLAGPGGAPPSPAPDAPPAGLTVATAAARWLEGDGPRLTRKQRRNYTDGLRVLLRVCGPEPAASFDALRLEAVRAAMASGSWMTPEEKAAYRARRRPVGWCANTVNAQVGRVRTVWRWLERQRLVPKGSWGELRLLPPLDGADRRVRRTAKRRPAEAADVGAVCARLRSRTLRAMLWTQWWTGMRPGEVRRMCGAEVDRSGEVWLYKPRKHKNSWRGQDRAVPIGPEAQKILGPRLNACGDGPAFVTGTGRPYGATAYALRVGSAARKAGRPWFVPYSVRHGAKRRITRLFGLDAARAVLGQASLGTTNEYAAGADLEQAAEVARRTG